MKIKYLPLIKTFSALAVIFLIQGCAVNHYAYVSQEFPNGNKVQSDKAHSECSSRVPESVKADANKTTYTQVPMYIAGIPGVTPGNVIYTSKFVCKGICAEARKIQNSIISKCMRDKGWQWRLLENKS